MVLYRSARVDAVVVTSLAAARAAASMGDVRLRQGGATRRFADSQGNRRRRVRNRRKRTGIGEHRPTNWLVIQGVLREGRSDQLEAMVCVGRRVLMAAFVQRLDRGLKEEAGFLAPVALLLVHRRDLISSRRRRHDRRSLAPRRRGHALPATRRPVGRRARDAHRLVTGVNVGTGQILAADVRQIHAIFGHSPPRLIPIPAALSP